MTPDVPGYSFATSGYPNVVMGAFTCMCALLVLWGAVGWVVGRLRDRRTDKQIERGLQVLRERGEV